MITEQQAREFLINLINAKTYEQVDFNERSLLLYIRQQEKKDELLGLYKELSIVRFYLFIETNADLGQELMNKDDDLNKQIKGLEEELK
jgi:hypothetical protein